MISRKIRLTLLCFALFLINPPEIKSQDAAALRANAEKIQKEAQALRATNTPESRRQATGKFIEAISLWESVGDIKNEAEALNALAEVSYLDGKMQNGLDYSQKSLPLYRQLGDRAMEAETLNNIGGFLDLLGESRKGLEYSLKSIEILRELGDKKREAISLNGVALVYDSLGEVQTALDYLNRAYVLRRETGDKSGEVKTLANLAYIYSTIGDKRVALEKFAEALKLVREVKDVRTEGIILNNMGLVWGDIGEYQKALDSFAAAQVLRRQTGDKRGEGITLSNIATVYNSLGETSQAIALSEQALQIFREGSFRPNEATTLSSLATMYSSIGDEQKSLELNLKSLEIRRTIEDHNGETKALDGIGLVYLVQNKPRQALEFLLPALQLIAKTKDKEEEGRVLLLLARTYENLGEKEKATENYQKSLAVRTEIGVREDAAETLYYWAQMESQDGKLEAARGKMRQVIDLTESLRRNISSSNLRSSYLATTQNYYEFYVDLLMRSHKSEPSKGFDALALQISERARARSLLESLGEAHSNIRNGVAPELLLKEKNLRQVINAKESQRLDAAKKGLKERAAVFEKELGELSQNYRDVQVEIRRQSPQFAALTQPEPLNLAEIQTQVLSKDSILLEYFLGAERSFLFAATPNSLEVYELPRRADVEKTARQFIETLRARAREMPQETAAQRQDRLAKADADRKVSASELSRILLAPVAAKIQNKRLLVVSSGILQYVPFAALNVFNPGDGNRKSQIANRKSEARFLIETNEIVNLPSASTLAVLRKTESNRKENAENIVAVIADPVFSADDVRLKALAKQPAVKNLPVKSETNNTVLPSPLRADFVRLRFSRQEAEAISAFVPDNKKFVALDFAANVGAASSDNFRKARIIHYATHGFIDSDFPELSGLVLSLVDEKGNAQDGFFRLYDIYNLRLEARLVVLSACETALGKEIKGEGIVGLARGFMYAGAPSVVASLWKVDDHSTAELMKRFYQKMLKENLRPAAALRAAQISLAREKTTENPFFWAAFTLQGEY